MFDNIFEIVFLAGYLAYLFGLYTPQKWRIRNQKIMVNRVNLLEGTLSFLGFVGMQLLPVIHIFTPRLEQWDYRLPAWAGWVGALLFVVAQGLLWRAHADLRRNWSASVMVFEGHELVTTGLYQHIRHPIYAANWLWAIAQTLLVQNWVAGLAGLVTFLPIYLYRIPREEQMLLQHFGDVYQEYMNRTGRIMPRLGA